MGNDIRYMPEKLETAKNFANKIWNASKFVLMNLEDYEYKKEEIQLTVEDKWILSKLNKLIKDVCINLDNYNLGVAIDNIYEFIWNEFCDWYVEMVKPRLYDKENKTRMTAQYVLEKVLSDSLKLLHPFMPFLTEKIYKNLPKIEKSIMISEYPKYNNNDIYVDEEIYIEEIKIIVKEIRNARANMSVHPSKKSKLIVVTKRYSKIISESEEVLKKLCFANTIIVKQEDKDIPENSISILSSNIKVFIPFEELIDIEEELQRLEKEKEKILEEKEWTDKMLRNEGFLKKAPVNKIEEIKIKDNELNEKLNNIEDRIKQLNEMV